MILGLDHVAIVVRDLEAASGFFEVVLGLVVEEEVERPTLRARFYGCGGIQLELIEIHDEAERAARLGDADLRVEHVAFRTPDAAQAAERLTAAGLDVQELRRTSGRVAFFASPDDGGPAPFQFVERP